MATYPDNKVTFDTVENGVDTVMASHVNLGYSEIEAIQGIVGNNPNARSGPWSTTGFNNSSTSFTNVKLRLDNVENGTNYAVTYLVNSTGGTTITTSADNVKGLIIKAFSGTQSANLMEFQTSGGSVISYFKPDGTFQTPLIDGGTA